MSVPLSEYDSRLAAGLAQEYSRQKAQAQPPEQKKPSVGGTLKTAGSFLLNDVLGAGDKFVVKPGMGYLYAHPTTAKFLTAGSGISNDQIQSWQQAAQQGGYTQAFNKRFEGHPWEKLIFGLGLDPMNLVGAGLVSKVAKGAQAAEVAYKGAQSVEDLQRVGQLSKANQALQTAAKGETLFNDLQSLPITVPLKGAKKVGGKIIEPIDAAYRASHDGQGLFEATPFKKVQDKLTSMADLLARHKGLNLGQDAARSALADEARQTAQTLNKMTQPEMQAAIQKMDPYTRGYIWQQVTDTINDTPTGLKYNLQPLYRVKGEIGRVLKTTGGLATADQLTPQLAAHIRLEEAMRLSGQDSLPQRAFMHGAVDRLLGTMANQADQFSRYQTAGDVLNDPNFMQTLVDAAKQMPVDEVQGGIKQLFGFYYDNMNHTDQGRILTELGKLDPTINQTLPGVIGRVKNPAYVGPLGVRDKVLNGIVDLFKRTDLSSNQDVKQFLDEFQRLSSNPDVAQSSTQLGDLGQRTVMGRLQGDKNTPFVDASYNPITQDFLDKLVNSSKATTAQSWNDLLRLFESNGWKDANGVAIPPQKINNITQPVQQAATGAATQAAQTVAQGSSVSPGFISPLLSSPPTTHQQVIKTMFDAFNNQALPGTVDSYLTKVREPLLQKTLRELSSDTSQASFETRNLINSELTRRIAMKQGTSGFTSGTFLTDLANKIDSLLIQKAPKDQILQEVKGATASELSDALSQASKAGRSDIAKPLETELRNRVQKVPTVYPRQTKTMAGAAVKKARVPRLADLPLEVRQQLGLEQIPRTFNVVPDAITHYANDFRSSLPADATTSQTVDRVAQRIGLSGTDPATQQVKNILLPIVGENPIHFQALQMDADPEVRALLAKALTDPTTADATIEQMASYLNVKWAGTGIRHPFLYKILKSIERPDLRDTGASRVFGRQQFPGSKFLDSETALIQDAINRPEVQAMQNEYDREIGVIDSTLREIATKVKTFKYDPNTTTWADVEKAYLKYAPSDRVEQLNALYQKWDLPKTELRTSTYESNLLDAYQKSLKKEFKLDAANRELVRINGKFMYKPKGKAARAFELGTKAWREQALLSVRYHAQNAADMLFKSVFLGVNPLISSDTALKLAQTWGFDALPESIRSSFIRAITDLPEEATSRTAWGTILGDNAVGNIANTVIDKNRKLAIWMETSARSAAWRAGSVRHMEQEFLPRFYTEAQRLGSQYGDTSWIADLQREGINLSPQQVYEHIFDRTNSAQLAGQVSQLWGRGISESSLAGENLALRIHFDFGDERNIEKALHLRFFMPFHMWATRNIPFYLDALAQNPWAIHVWRDWNQVSQEDQNSMGLTDKVKNKLSLGTTNNPVIGFFLGRGAQYFNPLVIMSITDQMRDPYVAPDATKAGRLLAQGQRFGISIAPWVDIPLNMLGVEGSVEPLGLWRQGDAFANLTGVDMKPTARITTTVRNQLPWTNKVHTISNSQRLDSQINRVIQEMSIEQTGTPNDPRYAAAMADPSSPIYQEAEKRVRANNLRTSMYGLISPIPHTTVDPTELAVRASAPQGPLAPEAYNFLRQIGHLSTGLNSTPNTKEQAQINAGFALKKLSPQTVAQVAPGLQSPDALPTFYLYLQWLDTLPPGADRSVKAFIKSLSNHP